MEFLDYISRTRESIDGPTAAYQKARALLDGVDPKSTTGNANNSAGEAVILGGVKQSTANYESEVGKCVLILTNLFRAYGDYPDFVSRVNIRLLVADSTDVDILSGRDCAEICRLGQDGSVEGVLIDKTQIDGILDLFDPVTIAVPTS